jgi:hypothetical protein
MEPSGFCPEMSVANISMPVIADVRKSLIYADSGCRHAFAAVVNLSAGQAFIQGMGWIVDGERTGYGTL